MVFMYPNLTLLFSPGQHIGRLTFTSVNLQELEPSMHVNIVETIRTIFFFGNKLRRLNCKENKVHSKASYGKARTPPQATLGD
jgi:hypothetical protein